MSNFINFTPNVDWGAVRVNYEESYDKSTNTSTLIITSIEAKSTSYYGATYFIDGVLKLNGETVLTLNSADGVPATTGYVYIGAQNSWYPITDTSSNTLTATIQVVHDHEGSETATIELAGNRFDKFGFYVSGGGYGSGWGVNESQTITLTVEKEDPEPEEPEPIVIPTSAYGSQDYLLNQIRFPKFPTWDKITYPCFFIVYHSVDDVGLFSLIAVDRVLTAENNLLTAGGETFSRMTWTVATDEIGDNRLKAVSIKAPYTEWYISSEVGDATQVTAENIVWSNTTLYNTDGSILIEASKGTWLIDVKSWLNGYAMGLANKPLYLYGFDSLLSITAMLEGYVTGCKLKGYKIRAIVGQGVINPIDATLEDTTLYIKKARAILNNGTLEVT